MPDVFTAQVLDNGWAVAGAIFLLVVIGFISGKIVSGAMFRRERERGDRWEASWYKLYAANEIRQASETKAVNEMALTLSAAIAGIRRATGGEQHEVVSQDDESPE